MYLDWIVRQCSDLSSTPPPLADPDPRSVPEEGNERAQGRVEASSWCGFTQGEGGQRGVLDSRRQTLGIPAAEFPCQRHPSQ